MAEQHNKLLEGFGIDKATIEKLDALKPEEIKDFKFDEITGVVEGSFKNKFLNDPGFLNSIPEDKIPADVKKKIESGQYGRFMNEITEVAKSKLGLEDKDFEDMTEKEKGSLKTMVEKVATKYLGKKGNVEGLQKMQQELIEANKKLTEKDSEAQEKLTKELEKINGANSAKLMRMITRTELSSLPDMELTVKPALVSDAILQRLQSKYALVLNDQDEIVLKQKAAPALDVLVDNKVFTFAQALAAEAIEQGAAKKKEEGSKDDGKKKRVTIGGEDDGEKGDGEFKLPGNIASKVEKITSLEK